MSVRIFGGILCLCLAMNSTNSFHLSPDTVNEYVYDLSGNPEPIKEGFTLSSTRIKVDKPSNSNKKNSLLIDDVLLLPLYNSKKQNEEKKTIISVPVPYTKGNIFKIDQKQTVKFSNPDSITKYLSSYISNQQNGSKLIERNEKKVRFELDYRYNPLYNIKDRQYYNMPYSFYSFLQFNPRMQQYYRDLYKLNPGYYGKNQYIHNYIPYQYLYGGNTRYNQQHKGKLLFNPLYPYQNNGFNLYNYLGGYSSLNPADTDDKKYSDLHLNHGLYSVSSQTPKDENTPHRQIGLKPLYSVEEEGSGYYKQHDKEKENGADGNKYPYHKNTQNHESLNNYGEKLLIPSKEIHSYKNNPNPFNPSLSNSNILNKTASETYLPLDLDSSIPVMPPDQLDPNESMPGFDANLPLIFDPKNPFSPAGFNPYCPYYPSREQNSPIGGENLETIKNGSEAKDVETKAITCEIGASWLSSCQHCVCGNEGVATCESIPDCVLRPYGEPMECKPYSAFDLDSCNKCQCNGDGIPVCTIIDCDASHYESKVTIPVKPLNEECQSFKSLRRCADGSSWRSSCYDCVCEKGERTCMKISDCQLREHGKAAECKPNTSYRNICTKCECNDEGEATCINLCHTSEIKDPKISPSKET